MLIRCAAITVGFAITISVLLILSGYFYIRFFDYNHFAPFILPFVITLIPGFSVILGLGMLVGRIHQGLIYVLMLIVLILGFAGIGGSFDFFGNGYFSSYPISMPVGADGEPEFAVSTGFLLARVFYLVAGVALMTMSVYITRQKAQRA